MDKGTAGLVHLVDHLRDSQAHTVPASAYATTKGGEAR